MTFDGYTEYFVSHDRVKCLFATRKKLNQTIIAYTDHGCSDSTTALLGSVNKWEQTSKSLFRLPPRGRHDRSTIS